LYSYPEVQRLEIKLINSIFVLVPAKNTKLKTVFSPITNYGTIGGYDAGCFTLWPWLNSQCNYKSIATHFIPESPSTINMSLWFYNANVNGFNPGTNPRASAFSNYFTTGNDVRIVIHGMQEDLSEGKEYPSSMLAIKNAFRAVVI
jgi:hypothetical protein